MYIKEKPISTTYVIEFSKKEKLTRRKVFFLIFSIKSQEINL